MTNEQLKKIRAFCGQMVENNPPLSLRREVIDILDRALAAPEQEPFCYVNVNAQGDVTRTIKREDKWCKTPLYRHPAPQSQPVARVTGYYGGNCVIEPLDGKTVVSSGMAVYSAPVAAQAAQPDPWISVKDAMPKSGVIVLAYYINSHNHSRRIRAKWTAAKTEEANAEFYWGEYDEETDTYWTPEGWYECIDNWDEFSSIMVSEGEITHWMPLPLAPDDPNYTAPPSREWQSLTNEEVVYTTFKTENEYCTPGWCMDFARAIESALRAKNSGEQA